MQKKHVIVLIILVVYSATMLLLLLNKNEKVHSLNQRLQDNEVEYLEKIEQANSETSSLKSENIKLQEENLELINKAKDLITIDGASIEGLKYNGISDFNIISEDLLSHPELIPYEGILGGTMAFTEIFVLK
ncbi:MAG: hypothetical protein CVV02_14240 [Firmicutes bacterium HGW-Firmicutes-7]|nr:MAG: hypothetical protein CVV02_14240 [Firmicutes bacterium HGW-Firmicutes-7]